MTTWHRPDSLEGLRDEIENLLNQEAISQGGYYSADRSSLRTRRQECEAEIKKRYWYGTPGEKHDVRELERFEETD